MGKINKFILKITKSIIFFIGLFVSLIFLGVGSYTTYRSNYLKTYISEKVDYFKTLYKDNRGKIDKIFDTIKPDSAIWKNIEGYKQEIKDQIKNLSGIFDENSKGFNDLENVLLTQKENLNKIPNSQNKKELIDQLDETIVLIQKTINESKSFFTNIVSETENFLNSVNIDDLKNFINELRIKVYEYITFIDYFQEKITKNSISQYYDIVSITLFAIGGTIVSLIAIGSILSKIFYKKFDGKIVNRFNAKNNLKKHLIKILKKYPSIASEI